MPAKKASVIAGSILCSHEERPELADIVHPVDEDAVRLPVQGGDEGFRVARQDGADERIGPDAGRLQVGERGDALGDRRRARLDEPGDAVVVRGDGEPDVDLLEPLNTSISRRSRADLDWIATGNSASARISRHRRVSLYLASSGW